MGRLRARAGARARGACPGRGAVDRGLLFQPARGREGDAKYLRRVCMHLGSVSGELGICCPCEGAALQFCVCCGREGRARVPD
eukprot:184601-Rhodomonas_salina.1